MKMKETDLRNQILDWLMYRNIYAWLNNTAGTYSKRTKSYFKNPRLKKGVADILGILPNGKLFAIECKVGKNKQDDNQKIFQKDIEANNGIYILAYNLEEVEKYLKNNKFI